MSLMRMFNVSVGDVVYRAEARVWSVGFGEFDLKNEFGLKVDVYVNRYEVVRVTDASYFVDDMEFRSPKPMRRSRMTFHPWARKTEEEAIEYLKRRSVSRLRHAQSRLNDARAVLLKLGINEYGEAT